MLEKQRGVKPKPEELGELFDRAKHVSGKEYLTVEQELRDRGAEAVRFLRERQSDDPDPFARFMARIIADWIDGKGEDYAPAMERLAETELRAKETEQGVPRADAAEDLLTQSFQDRLTGFVALRLVKETQWLPWKVEAAVLYLKRHKDPSTLPALIRYAVLMDERQRIDLAIETIKEVHGVHQVEMMVDEARFGRYMAEGRISPGLPR